MGWEEVSMDMPVIDAHVHLWDTGALDYPWLSRNPGINRPFLPADYREAVGGVPVEKMVFVQCECRPEQYLQELEWITAQAAGEPRIAAAVPWAPLEQGNAVRDILERMTRNPLVRGIRRIIEFEPREDFCLQPSFIEGVRLLEEFGLSFDININNTQMENTLAMVRRCPGVRFMLDHAAKPDIAGYEWTWWKHYITELARTDGMYCKISHFINRAGDDWTLEDLRPYVDHVIEQFGTDRVCFAGDFPVCNIKSSFEEWFDAVEMLTGGLTQSEKKRFFHDNARDFYRL